MEAGADEYDIHLSHEELRRELLYFEADFWAMIPKLKDEVSKWAEEDKLDEYDIVESHLRNQYQPCTSLEHIVHQSSREKIITRKSNTLQELNSLS